MTDLSLSIRPEADADADTIDKLHERAFGPGRFARTAYRLREGMPHETSLSFTALVGTLLVGSIRLTRIVAGGRAGAAARARHGRARLHEPRHRHGAGAPVARGGDRARGTRLSCSSATSRSTGRAGFKVPRGQLEMPGPVDPARLLALELEPGALPGPRAGAPESVLAETA